MSTVTDDFPSRISAIMWEAHRFAQQFKDSYGTDPNPGSPAHDTMHNSSESGPSGPWRPEDVYPAYSMAVGILIPAADQLLCALSHLYREPMALFGYQVVGRALAESAAKAWWMIEPGISVRTRMGRLYNERWDNCEAIRKVSVLVGEAGTTATNRAAKIRAEAAFLGLDEKFETRRDGSKGKFIGYEDGRNPGSTQLVHCYFEALNSPHGELWYRSMSAICHGTAYGLLESYADTYAGTPGMVTLTPRLTPQALAHVAIMSVEMYLGALQFLAQAFGWTESEVGRKREFFRNVLLDMARDQHAGRG